MVMAWHTLNPMQYIAQKKYYIVCAFLLFFIAHPSYAVTTSADITLTTSGSPSETVTLVSGSQYDTLTVNNDGFTFTLSGSQQVTINSSSRRELSNTFSVPTTCADAYSQVILSASKGSSVSVSIPAHSCSGGGGGGGGGSGPIVRTTVATTTATSTSPTTNASSTITTIVETAPEPPITQPITIATSPLFPGILNIPRRLYMGISGNDVRVLQEALASMPDIYPEGLATGYFGSLTKRAVQRFQERYNVAKEGAPGYGDVGPGTRAKLQELFGSKTVASQQTGEATVTALQQITRELDMGDNGEDVKVLQTFLSSIPGVYPEGLTTGRFGPLTRNAVKRFQEHYGISSVGRVGPQTLAKLHELMGTPISPTPAQGTDTAASLQNQIENLKALMQSLTDQITQAKQGQ